MCFLTWPCREVGIRNMNRRYGSGYGSGIRGLARTPLNSCFVALDTANWRLESRENLDRLVATRQPGALVSGLTAATLREWVSESCCARWKAQSHFLRRTSWPPRLGVQATRALKASEPTFWRTSAKRAASWFLQCFSLSFVSFEDLGGIASLVLPRAQEALGCNWQQKGMSRGMNRV